MMPLQDLVQHDAIEKAAESHTQQNARRDQLPVLTRAFADLT
jgi:hypothetical protein